MKTNFLIQLKVKYYIIYQGYLEFDCNNLKFGYYKYDFKKYFNTVEKHKFDV